MNVISVSNGAETGCVKNWMRSTRRENVSRFVQKRSTGAGSQSEPRGSRRGEGDGEGGIAWNPTHGCGWPKTEHREPREPTEGRVAVVLCTGTYGSSRRTGNNRHQLKKIMRVIRNNEKRLDVEVGGFEYALWDHHHGTKGWKNIYDFSRIKTWRKRWGIQPTDGCSRLLGDTKSLPPPSFKYLFRIPTPFISLPPSDGMAVGFTAP